MYIYYCWITTLLPTYQDGIVAGLARRGYMVGPAAKDGQVTFSTEKCPSALVALSVYKAEETNVSNIYNDLVEVLQEMGAYYYSVVIVLSSEATWAGSNFQLPIKGLSSDKPIPPPLPGTKKNMN